MRENLVYLDDSASMDWGLLQHGQHIARDIFPMLKGTTTRLVKFGSQKTVLSGRTDKISDHSLSLWDASSGATYMWHMVRY